MNRYEQHVYAQKLAAIMAEVNARLALEKSLGKLAAERILNDQQNAAESAANGWHMHYDYARAFDGPLRTNGGW